MYRIIKKSEWKKSKWSGGETNEIFIYPEKSSYVDRDFKVRISIANTENDEKMEFTHLPGVSRFISKLEGDLYISHYGKYDTDLNQYEIESFNGDWRTYSFGKYKDFNLMLKNIRGDLCFAEIDGVTTLNLQKGSTITFLFIIEGEIEIVDEYMKLEATDTLISDVNKLHLNAKKAKIYYGFAKDWEDNKNKN